MRMATKKTIVKKKAKKPATSGGRESGRWNNHKFTISPQLIRGFSELKIKGSSEMDKKDDDNTGYVSRKGASPTEVSLTVHLNALTGCDVRKEALALIAEARSGEFDYFYVAGSKLVPYKLMLTDAQVSEVEMSPGGTWIKANVALTMKQCNKDGSSYESSDDDDSSGGGGGGGSSSGGGGGGGSSKYSVYDSSPTTYSSTPSVARIASASAPSSSVGGSVTQSPSVPSVTSGSSGGNWIQRTVGTVVSAVQNLNNRISSSIAKARSEQTGTVRVIGGGGVNRNELQ